MDPVKLGQVTNSDVYIDGNQIVGRVREFSIEGVTYEEVEHKALGMIGGVNLPGRTLEPMKATIAFDWLDSEVMRKTARPNKVVTMQFQSFVDVFDQSGVNASLGYRLITSVDLLFGSSTIDAFKHGENSGEELEASVLRLVITTSKTTVPIREISVADNINRADGVDVWPTY